MGNSASSSRAHHDDSVDYGFLVPQGVYTGPRDWNQQIVSQLIVERRLAPFYRPLEDYDESWDDEQILASRKELLDQDVAPSESTSAAGGTGASPARSNSINSVRRPGSLKEPSRIPEAMVYRDAVECPICFLYYPPNINHSRCCDQAICTECFVQIKRSEPTTTHLVSEPAACPYCVQENFGVTYTPPTWRAGIGAEGSNLPPTVDCVIQHSPINSASLRASSQPPIDSRGRRRSLGANSIEVVTIDQIRPDWEAKLAAVRAAVARRANRRIIMRQVGDRLIPVGVTSGRIHSLPSGEIPVMGEQGGENISENEGRGGRRSRRRQHQQQPQDINQLLGTMGLGGQDLEELMIMEAMRLSLLEHEEQQRKEAEKKKKEEAERAAKGGEANGGTDTGCGTGPSSSALQLELPPIPTAPIEVAKPSCRGPFVSDPSFTDSSSLNSGRSPIPSSFDQHASSVRQRALAGTSLQNISTPAASDLLDNSTAQSGSRPHLHSGSTTSSFSAATPQLRPSTDLLNAPPLSMAGATAPSSNDDDSELELDRAGNTEAHVDGGETSTSLAVAFSPSDVEFSPHTHTLAAAVPAAPAENVPNHSSTSLVVESGEGQSHSSLYEELPSSPESAVSHRPLLLETLATEHPDMIGPGEHGERPLE
ncbi:hypothetical protein EW145_g5061 [Phellinidium pouzarii]|uniref:RING-type domain-containing protein n=1 Tax=Phellinidium pouzarii TaxID=167371 RepID=A0A4S4L1B6_9AGAM|nr:hypothetical protein EW145_g5061 [Phellinidium pouzarii]